MGIKRLRIGIIFNFNQAWMGGIIYILNLIKTLDFLDDDEKPEIFLFYRPDLKKFVDQVHYTYMESITWNFPSVYKGFITSWLTGKNQFVYEIIKKFNLDGLYPLHDYPVKTETSTKLVCWYADLQHEYYPEFFKRKKIVERTLRIKFILRNSDDLVVSSRAVADDFYRFFRIREDLKIHIYHFVSVIDDFSHLKIDDLRKRYNLPAEYYMVSNQFHKHKNHKVLIMAQIRLKKEGIKIHLAMTGRFPDASFSPYMQELHSLINKNDLHGQISFLGLLPRDEQLMLMKYSRAVLQPSLFEGWSTVIEDAKSLQVPVVASNLPVNVEQLGDKGVYFDPYDDKRLSDILSEYPERNLSDVFYEEYEKRIKDAARIFMDIFAT